MAKTIAVDFDGVIHAYTSGWKGPRVIPDGPVEGAIDFLLESLSHGYTIAIYSSRSHAWGGRRAMKHWLEWHASLHFFGMFLKGKDADLGMWHLAGYQFGMDPPADEAEEAAAWLVRTIQWPKHKPPAMAYLDDRAVTFTGKFPHPSDLGNFKPWNKR